MAQPKIDLNSLVGPSSQPGGTTAIQTGLVAILDPVLNAHTAPTELAAESVAGDIDSWYAGTWDTEEKAESFFWFVWELYIEAAKKIPADDVRQQFLVSVLGRLKSKKRENVKIWRQEAIVWDNLPLLGPCLREAWNLRRKFDNSEEDNVTLQQWLSLNSFNARLLGGLVQDHENFALWALRESLEAEPVNDTARDHHLTVVYEWIEHAGKVIYDKGRTPKELDGMEKQALKPGKLFEGESGFTEKRWQFWRQRLEELGKGLSNEEVKTKAQKAVEKMKSLEG